MFSVIESHLLSYSVYTFQTKEDWRIVYNYTHYSSSKVIARLTASTYLRLVYYTRDRSLDLVVVILNFKRTYFPYHLNLTHMSLQLLHKMCFYTDLLQSMSLKCIINNGFDYIVQWFYVQL